MKADLLLTAKTPLSFRRGRERDQAGTLNYVPGTAIYGGLAAAHGLLRPNQRDEFAMFFLSERLGFSNLYPAKFGESLRQFLNLNDHPVYPLPRTARTCKRFGGFHFGAEAEGEDRHGVRDQLIPLALFTLSGEQNTAPLDQARLCGCGQELDHIDGFYRRGLQPKEIGQPKSKKGLRTRTGIDRATGAVQEGILYSREVLSAKTRFWGTLTIFDENDNELFQAFDEFVEDVIEARLLRIGNNRTRGFGRVVLNIEESEEEDEETIAQQAKAFDRLFRAEAKRFGIKTPAAFYLPLTLISDVILYDKLLRSQLQLTGNYLAERWGLSEAKLVYKNAARRLVSGWNGVWGLPKTDEWAIAMGSVFLFALPSEPDFSLLARLQHDGIGARRHEGFGQVRVAASFHQEVKLL